MPHCLYCKKYFFETTVSTSHLSNVYCSEDCIEKAKNIEKHDHSIWAEKNRLTLKIAEKINSIIYKTKELKEDLDDRKKTT